MYKINKLQIRFLKLKSKKTETEREQRTEANICIDCLKDYC